MMVLPGLIRPMLATLRPSLPADQDGYGWEFKWDGVRAIAYVSGGEVRLISRNDKDMTGSYPELAVLADRVGAPVILDDEIVALRAGRPDFGHCNPGCTSGGRPPGWSRAPRCICTCSTCCTTARTRCCTCPTPSGVTGSGSSAWTLTPVRTPPWYRDDAEIVLAASLAHGLEGVVGKPLASRYHPGGRRDWIKVKNIRHQEVIICGWNQGEGGRANTIGSLVLGVCDDDRLRYAGNVGTGFTEAMLADLMRQLGPLKRDTARSAPRCRPGMPAARTGWNLGWSARSRSLSRPATGACATRAGAGFAPTRTRVILRSAERVNFEAMQRTPGRVLPTWGSLMTPDGARRPSPR